MSRPYALLILAGLLCSSLGLISACSPVTPTTEIRIQLSADPVSLDPSLAEDGVSLRVLQNTMEGLVGYDSKGVLEPRLAESFRFSGDGKEIEFSLRKNIFWSDGEPVQVADFVTGLRRSLAPETASKLALVFSPIQAGAAGVFERDGKLVIRLSRPAPYLLDAFTMAQAMPQRANVLGQNGGKWPFNGPVTGHYRVKEYKINQHLFLVPNEHYLEKASDSKMDSPRGGAAAPRNIRLMIVSDEATAKNLFEQKRLDVLTRVNSFEFERYRAKGWLRVDPFPATYYLSFNMRKGLSRDRRFRRAVAGSIQFGEVIQALHSGERAATGWIPEGIEGHLEQAPDRHTWARDWHAKSAGNAMRKVVAGFDSGGRNSLIMEKVQRDLEMKLGFRIQLENMDWKSYIKRLQVDAPELFRFAWLAPFHDPIVHLQVFVTGNPNNYSGWSNPQYDRLVSEIESMVTGKVRAQKIRDAQKILLEEAAVVPIYQYAQVTAVGPEVEGFIMNPFGWIPFHRLRKRP